ncbi:MAG: serine/threonine protein kinase [Anaerolineae bacterium]|nr:serine/threonine protein kinase [Anaerolineae bacterium]
MFLHTGDQVGAYTIKQLVGQGGMATVYRAYHAQLDRDVAIKIMLQDYRDDPHFVARFEREARIVASLEHPHIVPVYDFNQHEGNPYLVMKYIEGRTLKQRLLKGALPLDEVLSIMSAVGDALTYAHGKGVLHRDIKPSNIVIDIQETPYITDFGLARMVHLGESTLSADMLLGTPHYIAPEQARGEKNLDGRSDLYAFGVILYELLVGHVPFTGDTPYAIIHDHIYTPLPLPSSLNSDIPPAVESVLLKALAKKRDDRYSTANELVADLTMALKKDGLQELDPRRVEKAAQSYVSPRDAGISQGISTDSGLGLATIDVSSELQQVSTEAPVKTVKQMRKANGRRFWQGVGCAGLLVSMLVIALLMLSAVNNLMQLRELDLGSDIGQTTQAGTDQDIEYMELSDAYGFPTLNLDVIDLDNLPDQLPGNMAYVSYLVSAASYWAQGDSEQAQDSISDGVSTADDSSIYFANASILANQYGDATSAVLYAVLSQARPSQNDDYATRIHAYNLEYLYQHLNDVDSIQAAELLSLASDLTDGQINIRETLNSPLVNYIQSIRLIADGNYILAGTHIESLLDVTEYRTEAQLLRADSLIARGQTQRAMPILQGILEDVRAPEWVHTTADTHLKEIEASS